MFGVVLWDFSNVKYVSQKVWKTVSVFVMVIISIHTTDVSFARFVPNTQERTHVLLDEGIVGERYCPPAYLGLSSFQNKLTNRL